MVKTFLLIALFAETSFAGQFIPAPGVCSTGAGSNSVVCQGSGNNANATNSFAAGTNAKATANGAFIFTDDSTPGVDVVNSSSNSIVLRFAGGGLFSMPVSSFTGSIYANNYFGNASSLTFSGGTPNQVAFFSSSGTLISSGTFTFRTAFAATGAGVLKVGEGPAAYNTGPTNTTVQIEVAGQGGMSVLGVSHNGLQIGLFGYGPDGNFDLVDDFALDKYIMRHEINSQHTTFGDNFPETDFGIAATDIGFNGVSTFFRKDAVQSLSTVGGSNGTFYYSGATGDPNNHFWFSENHSAYHAMAGVTLVAGLPLAGQNQVPYFSSTNTVLQSSSSFQFNGASITIVNIPMGLLGPDGTITGVSSITASAFFGDGSHLTNVAVTGSTATITSTSTIGGFSSTLGAGTTFFAYLTDTAITLSRITVTINNAGVGGAGDTYACQDSVGNSLQVTATAGAPAGSIFSAAGTVSIAPGSTVNGLLTDSTAAPTPVANVICSFNKTFNASSTEHFPRASTGAVTNSAFGTSSTIWNTDASISTVTLLMSGGRANISFSCEALSDSAEGRVFAGALIDGAFFNGETTTAGLGPVCATSQSPAGQTVTCPMGYSVTTLQPLIAGSHKFAFIYRVDGGTAVNFFNNQSQACQFNVTEQ